MTANIVRRWALVRLALGTLQMFGASAALVLIITEGLTRLAIGTAVVTCLVTTVSVILFGSRDRK